MLSTSQARAAYAPACQDSGKNFLSAWQAFNLVCQKWQYGPDANSGFFNCRAITGGTDYSLHAYPDFQTIRFWNGRTFTVLALAFDINPTRNPYGSVLITDIPRGMFSDVLRIRTKSGAQVFRAGAYYSGNKDAMHFEIVCLPRDLASGINMNTVAGAAPTPTPTPTPSPTLKEDGMLVSLVKFVGEPTAAGDQPDVTAIYKVRHGESASGKAIPWDASHVPDEASLGILRYVGAEIQGGAALPIKSWRGVLRFLDGPFKDV